ncbi:MAG: hypothetical protein L0Y73_06365 [Candidatus Aminicenantes bacterium]|nr:hypothetical protein [Candidatus Aminicenantes bacterium]
MRIINTEDDKTEAPLLLLNKGGKFHAGNCCRQAEAPLLVAAVVIGQA